MRNGQEGEEGGRKREDVLCENREKMSKAKLTKRSTRTECRKVID